MLAKFKDQSDTVKLLSVFFGTIICGLLTVSCFVLIWRALPATPAKPKAVAAVKAAKIEPDVQDFEDAAPIPSLETFSHEIKLLAKSAKFADWPAISPDNQKAIAAYMAAVRCPDDSPDAHLLRKRYYLIMAWEVVNAGKANDEHVFEGCDFWDEMISQFMAKQYVNPRTKRNRAT